MSETIVIGGQNIEPGSRQTINFPLPGLYVSSSLSLQTHVMRGRRDGPRLFVFAAIHGDELNGIEIITRILDRVTLKSFRGLLIAVPIVNIYGVINQSRYLPDRRDLNRSFPGRDSGSLASRMADLLMTEIVSHCTHGIDLHTGAIHRTNLPQIRADLSEPETEQMARAFGVPVLLNASLRDGSLREAARGAGVHMLLYEAGEALRFDEFAIRPGVQGVINVMRMLKMLPARSRRRRLAEPFVARSSSWVRAPSSGLFRHSTEIGSLVEVGAQIGEIMDFSVGMAVPIVAPFAGVLIGLTQIPLVHEGDALFHVGRFEDSVGVAGEVDTFRQTHDPGFNGADIETEAKT